MSFFGSFYRVGDEIYQHNNKEKLKLFFVEQFGFNHWLDGEIFKALDVFAKHHVNGFRCFGFWPYGRGEEQEPYIRTGHKKYDLNRFNEPFFEYQTKWVKHAMDLGIIVRYEIFDRCGLTTRDVVSDHHPYNTLVGRDRWKFSNLDDRDLNRIQKAYIEKIVKTLRSFPNVIFGVMNEFKSNPDWHEWVSKEIQHHATDNLISASEEGNPAAKDPRIDMWWVHTGTYNRKTGEPNVSEDIEDWRKEVGRDKVMGFSTDGFGNSGMPRENPKDMRRLAEDVVESGIQMFSFLDQKSTDWNTASGSMPGRVHLLNTETYDAIVDVFQPTSLAQIELPDGMLSATPAYSAPSFHPKAFLDKHGRAVRANRTSGFLFFGNYQKYSVGTYMAVFQMFIDNNTFDNAYICILDIIKNREEIVDSITITRKTLPKAQEAIQMLMSFTVDDSNDEYEMRVFYLGYAYLAVSGVLVIDPKIIKVPEDIPLPFFGERVLPPPVEDAVFSLTTWTERIFNEKDCRNYGGSPMVNSYIPRNKGGLEVFFTMPTDWRLTIKLKGTILGQEIEDESKGGKVSLFEAETVNKSITFGLQRMYNGYRGKGIFRFIARWGDNGSLNLITAEELSGYYSMKDWSTMGTHTLIFECRSGALRFKVNNSYTSRPAAFPWAVAANRSICCMIGNRLNRLSNQHAQTEFTEFTVEKI